jgi:hypothetical protein
MEAAMLRHPENYPAVVAERRAAHGR